MKHLLSTITLLFISSGVIAADLQITKEKMESDGKQRAYYLYVPEAVKSSKSVPLVVLLHGSGRNGLSLVEKWKDLASKENFIIVGPDSSGAGWRAPEDGPEFIHDLTEMLIKKFNADPKQVYLFGHSAGAVFALDLAMWESEYFAAVAVHAGSWRSKEEFTYIDLAKRKTPLKIIVGDRDSFFSMDSVRKTEKALNAKQFPIEVMVMSGHDHWYYDLASEINNNAWEFLKKNTLPGEPRHVAYNSNITAGDASAALNQVNAFRLEAEKLNVQVYAKEEELSKKDPTEKAAISEIGGQQIRHLRDGAEKLREAANAAEQASKLKITSKQQQYFSLIATACLKRAEAFDLIRARTELLLTGADPNSINTKRDEFAQKANVLNDEALELEKKAQQLLGG